MKFLIITICLSVSPAWVGAALPVVDAGLIASQRLSSEKDYVEQLIQSGFHDLQAKRLMEQIVQIDESLRRLGDPAAVSRLAGADLLLRMLREEELTLPSGRLLEGAVGGEVLVPSVVNDGRISAEVLIDGEVVAARNPGRYQREASLQRAMQQYQAVRTQVLDKRARLKAEIAANIEQVKTARTTSEVQKLSLVAEALDTQLSSLDRELQFAALEVEHLSEVLSVSNAVENKAALEDQRAIFSEAAKRDAKKFKISTGPVLFNR